MAEERKRGKDGRFASAIPERPRTERITAKIDAISLERVKAFAKADGRSPSEWMALAIVDAAEARFQDEQTKSPPDGGDSNAG